MLRILILSIILSACMDKEEAKNLPFKTEDYSILISSNAINTFGPHTIQEKAGHTFLYYYDYLIRAITKVDLTRKELIQNLPIDDNKIFFLGAVELLRNDTSFILRNLNHIYIGSLEGEIDRVDLVEEGDSINGKVRDNKWRLVNNIVNRYNFSKASKMTFLASAKANYEANYLNDLVIINYDLVNKKVKQYATAFDFQISNTQSFLFRSDPFLTEAPESLIVSFAFSPKLYVIDKDSLSTSYSYDYPAFSMNKPALLSEFDFLSGDTENDLNKEPYYHALIYDEFRNRYYRFIRYPAPESVDEMEFKLKLMVFDQELALIGTVDLGKKYGPFIYPTKEGLLIRHKLQRESYIDLDKLIIEL